MKRVIVSRAGCKHFYLAVFFRWHSKLCRHLLSVRDTELASGGLVVTNGKAVLTLLLSMMGGVWKNTFRFELLSVELDKVDVLEGKLRDAEEEIVALKGCVNELSRSTVLVLRPIKEQLISSHCELMWDEKAHSIIPAHIFSLSTDFKQVKILRDGLYQIDLVLTGGELITRLEVCGEAPRAVRSGHITHLKTDDVLQVSVISRTTGANVWLEADLSHFTILYLG
jgi:hypothetical protein